MSNMFNGASAFNQPIINWNTFNVTNMSSMFENTLLFNQYIQVWNTTNVTNYDNMFLNSVKMILNYNGATGFGTTPTSEFFNQMSNLDDNNIVSVINSWFTDSSQAILLIH